MDEWNLHCSGGGDVKQKGDILEVLFYIKRGAI